MRYLILAVSALLLALVASGQASAYPTAPETGVRILDEEKVCPGYVLFAPMFGDDSVEAEGTVYLVNVHGEVVHKWEMDSRPGFYAQLLPNGNLLYSGVSVTDKQIPIHHGGVLQEINWDGDVVWSYENDYMHHDFNMLPSGNIAALVYQQMPVSLSEQVQGGVPGTEMEDGSMWADSIIEVDREGNIVWRWDSWEHLDPVQDALHPVWSRYEWTHSNSVRYIESDPLTGSEAYLISIREINTVALIDRETGDFIWRWGPGVITRQHDARPLDNGNILIFDNGEGPRDTGPVLDVPHSRVLEVDPRDNGGTVVWEYAAEGLYGWRFFSAIISGAQRLPNGNTLITEGVGGRIFEVTPDKEIVWEYMNPYGIPMGSGQSRETWVFKALKYSPDDIDWPETLPDPLERLSQEEDEVVAPEVSTSEDGDQPAAAPETSLATAEDDGGDLTRWQGAWIGIGASLVSLVVGFVLARLVMRRGGP